MNFEVKQQILNKIREYDTIMLFRHVRNDGDCVGATKGMKAIICASACCKMGKRSAASPWALARPSSVRISSLHSVSARQLRRRSAQIGSSLGATSSIRRRSAGALAATCIASNPARRRSDAI